MKVKSVITAVALAATTMGTLAATPSFADARHDRLTAQRNFWKGHAQNRARIIRAQRSDIAAKAAEISRLTNAVAAEAANVSELRDYIGYAVPTALGYLDSVMDQVANGDLSRDIAMYTFNAHLDHYFSMNEQDLIDLANDVDTVTTAPRNTPDGGNLSRYETLSVNYSDSSINITGISQDPTTGARVIRDHNITIAGASLSDISVNITAAIQAEKEAAYDKGYENGYKDGFVDGFAAGVGAVQDELN